MFLIHIHFTKSAFLIPVNPKSIKYSIFTPQNKQGFQHKNISKSTPYRLLFFRYIAADFDFRPFP